MTSMMYTAKYRWVKVRRTVLQRDGYSCQLRLRGCTQYATQIDHKLSVMQGGTDDFDNLQAACKWCNLMKGAGFLDGERSLDASPGEISAHPPSSAPFPLLSGDYTDRHRR